MYIRTNCFYAPLHLLTHIIDILVLNCCGLSIMSPIAKFLIHTCSRHKALGRCSTKCHYVAKNVYEKGCVFYNIIERNLTNCLNGDTMNMHTQNGTHVRAFEAREAWVQLWGIIRKDEFVTLLFSSWHVTVYDSYVPPWTRTIWYFRPARNSTILRYQVHVVKFKNANLYFENIVC